MNAFKLNIQLFATLTLVVFSTGCATTQSPPKVADKLIWTSDGEVSRPMWTLVAEFDQDASAQVVRVVGMSNRHSTQRGARDAAMDDARRQIANYLSSQIEDTVERMESGGDVQSRVQDPKQELNRLTRQVSIQAVNGMRVEEWRFEQWLDTDKRQSFYQAFVRASVSTDSFRAHSSGRIDDMRGSKGQD